MHFRHNYWTTSFVRTPGSVVGDGLPDILADVQDIVNATARSLVKQHAACGRPAGGVINDDRLANSVDSDDLYPWRRWHVISDPTRDPQAPVTFNQPQSNAAELMGVYEKWNQIADEISLPRYLTGSERAGGAGRTASGLAMLLGNASKLLQQVAANIDTQIVQGSLDQTWELGQMTGMFRDLSTDIQVRVRGVSSAQQMETMRAQAAGVPQSHG